MATDEEKMKISVEASVPLVILNTSIFIGIIKSFSCPFNLYMQ